MDTKQLMIAWLEEKFSNDPTQLNQHALELLAKYAVSEPEFQEWLQTYKAKLEAINTPEAVKAEMLEKKRQIEKQIAFVDKIST